MYEWGHTSSSCSDHILIVWLYGFENTVSFLFLNDPICCFEYVFWANSADRWVLAALIEILSISAYALLRSFPLSPLTCTSPIPLSSSSWFLSSDYSTVQVVNKNFSTRILMMDFLPFPPTPVWLLSRSSQSNWEYLWEEQLRSMSF